MTFVKGQSGNPGGRSKAVTVAEVRVYARSYTTEAVDTLVRWMRQKKQGHVAVAAANAILNRGWGTPFHDPESGEHINITIRKILEGSVTEVEPSPPQKEPLVIDHDKTGSNSGSDRSSQSTAAEETKHE